MNNRSRFEKKFGKYAIPNLTLILILCYVVGYVLQAVNSNLVLYLALNPYLILRGQVWRLFTWVLIPPSGLNIFTVFMLFFYYNIGVTLERTWGDYHYNVYLLSGMLFTILGGFLCMGYLYLRGYTDAQVGAYFLLGGALFFSTYYVNLSIFLAFAATFPDVEVLLMFVIPVKMKWMGFLYGGMIVWYFITAGGGTEGIFTRFAIAASLLNFVVFFLRSRNLFRYRPKEVKRRAQFKQQVRRNPNPRITKHKCAICGRSEEDAPELEFRFCSKCNGNYEYCQNHLFTHEHVK
ncbi:MAG: hypothetical protein IJ833_07965 [Lachnospiraceae bacterium]|nr:hypothetical protein [Lachnospiraceae bacterium]